MATRCCWPPRELAGIAIRNVAGADAVEQGLGLRARRAPGHALHLHGPLHHVLRRGHMREEIDALEHHAGPAPLRRDLPWRERVEAALALGEALKLAVHEDAARRNALELVDAAQERRLARARGPDGHADLARPDREIDASQRLHLAVELADPLHPHRKAIRARLGVHVDPPALGGDAATEPLLEVVLADHQHRGDHEVPERGDHQERHRQEGPVGDGVRREGQVEREGHGEHEGRHLYHADGLVARWRDDDPHRLRQEDPPPDARGPHAEGLRRLRLPSVDGVEARAEDLGEVCALVQAVESGCGPGRTARSMPSATRSALGFAITRSTDVRERRAKYASTRGTSLNRVMSAAAAMRSVPVGSSA